MARTELKTIYLCLTDFPAYHLPDSTLPIADHISRYLGKVLGHTAYMYATNIQIPSVADLAVFLKSPYLTIYDALRALRQQGYDYELSQFNKPVLIRRIPIVSQSRRRRYS